MDLRSVILFLGFSFIVWAVADNFLGAPEDGFLKYVFVMAGIILVIITLTYGIPLVLK